MGIITSSTITLLVRSLVLRKRSSDVFGVISTSCRGVLDKLRSSRSDEDVDESRQSISANAKVAQWRNMNLPPQFQGSIDSEEEEEEGGAFNAFVAINDARAFHRGGSGPDSGERPLRICSSDYKPNILTAPPTRDIPPNSRRADGRLRRCASQRAAAAGERPRDRRTAAGAAGAAAGGLG